MSHQCLTQRSKSVTLVLAAMTLFLAGASLYGQQTFGATAYLDYRSNLTDSGPLTLKPSSATTAYLSNAFLFRRAYFTYENKISDNLKFRFRFDADNTANVTAVSLSGSSVSLSKDDKLRPYIKHLYLEYANFLIPKLVLNAGMIETLTFKPAEERWGYRSVAKTLVDGYKDITKKDILATSADIGATLKYSFSKHLRVAGGVYNGAHYSHAENDQFKKVQVQAQVTPIPGLSVVGYMDSERKLPVTTLPAVTKPGNRTYKLDAFFERIKNLVIGGEWFVFKSDLYQTGGKTYDVGGWSVFGRYGLAPEKLTAFARYDDYTPNSLDRGLDMSLAIIGFDWTPFHASWKIQPNVWIYSYRDGLRYNAAATKNSDVAFNLTLFLSF